MAGDTRDSNQPAPRGPPPGATEPPEHVKIPNKVYEVFHSPPQNANVLPEGSGQNTAGGRERPPALTDAVKTIKLEDFKKVHMYPCVRESLLMGIGSGFGIGGIRALWGGMVFSISIEELLLMCLCCSSNTEGCQLGGGNIRLCFVCQLRILSI
jgi:cytochrome c oxidase assembly protein subunit 20